MVLKRSRPRKMLSGVSAVRAQSSRRLTVPGAGGGSPPSRLGSWLVVTLGAFLSANPDSLDVPGKYSYQTTPIMGSSRVRARARC